MKKIAFGKIIPIIALVISIILVVIILADFFPLIREIIHDSKNESKIIDYIHAYGSKAVPVLIALQFLFSLMPFLPNAPIQILAGLCYGIWLGSLICVIGFVLSNSLLFYLVRESGNFIEEVFHKQHKDKHSGLRDRINRMENPFKAVLIMYLNPMIPSSILTYFFSKTKITYPRFLLSMTAACIPLTVIYSWLGERISKGDYKAAIILAAAIIVLIGLILLFRKIGLKSNKEKTD